MKASCFFFSFLLCGYPIRHILQGIAYYNKWVPYLFFLFDFEIKKKHSDVNKWKDDDNDNDNTTTNKKEKKRHFSSLSKNNNDCNNDIYI